MLIGVSSDAGTFSTREIWRTPRLRSSNGPIVHRDEFLYGFAGPQLICMSADTPEVVWRERTGAGTLMAADDRLVVLSQETGDLLIAEASPKGLVRSVSVRVLDAGVRAVTGPSFAGGRLYVRNLREIVALRIE